MTIIVHLSFTKLGKLLDLGLERKLINQTQYDDIWEDNTLRWLFGSDKGEAEKLIQKILS